MCSRDFLEGLRVEQRAADRARTAYDKAFSLAIYGRGGCDSDHVYTGRADNRVEDKILRSVDASRRADMLEKRVSEIRSKAEWMISLLGFDGSAQRIIRLRYLDGKRWEEIQELMQLSRSGVFRAHQRGLDYLDSHCQF